MENIKKPERPKRPLSNADLIKIALAALATGVAAKAMRDAYQDPTKRATIEQKTEESVTHGFDSQGWYTDYGSYYYDDMPPDWYDQREDGKDVSPSEEK